MKKLNNILIGMMFLPIVISLIFFLVLPDSIPVHYGVDGVVDRYGSKYEMLILPIICILFGGIFLLTKNMNEDNRKGMLLAGILSLGLFNVMNIYFLGTAFYNVNNLNRLVYDLNQVICFMLGIMLIGLGMYMPKLKRNSLIGFRTMYSLENDIMWQKSQEIGGKTFIVDGILFLIVSIFIKGWMCLVINMSLLLISVGVASYKSAKLSKIYKNHSMNER